MNEIAYPYALAFFNISDEQGKISEYYEWLITLQDVLQLEPYVYKFLESPRFKKFEKEEFLNNIYQKMEMPQHIQSFLHVLLDNNRFLFLDEIISEYDVIAKEKEGKKIVDVYSSFPLDDATKIKLQQQLSKKFTGKIYLRYKIDKNLIGGIKIIYDGEIIDNSTFNQLKNIKNILKVN